MCSPFSLWVIPVPVPIPIPIGIPLPHPLALRFLCFRRLPASICIRTVHTKSALPTHTQIQILMYIPQMHRQTDADTYSPRSSRQSAMCACIAYTPRGPLWAAPRFVHPLHPLHPHCRLSTCITHICNSNQQKNKEKKERKRRSNKKKLHKKFIHLRGKPGLHHSRR